MQNNGSQPLMGGDFVGDPERRARFEQAVWGFVGTMWRNRTIIIAVTGITAVLSVVIALLLPKWYRAESRLLLPGRSGSGLIAGALSELPSAAKSLLGGASGDYSRYLTILWSRSLAESTIHYFDLTTVYETAESDTPVYDAMLVLWDNSGFTVDEEFEHLTIAVMDQDPQRAADLTNFMVDELGRINARLASASAAKFRTYIEQRYNETEAALDSVLTEQRKLQEKYGIIFPVEQSEVLLENMAGMRLAMFSAEADYAQLLGEVELEYGRLVGQAELEYEQLLSMYGPENSLVRQAREAMVGAQNQYQKAMRTARQRYEQSRSSAQQEFNNVLDGGERLLPIPADSIPAISQEFFNLQKEQVILAELIKYSRPVLEEARFDEQREVEAVQVVDRAVPPERKFKPKRAIVCIGMTVSGFILVVLFVLVRDWWRRNYRYLFDRVQEAASQPAPERAVIRKAASKKSVTS